MKTLVLFIAILASHMAIAQKVANFSTGTYGQKDFEKLEFWTTSKIVYTYGANNNTYDLALIKPNKDKNTIIVQFPNRKRYSILIGKDMLFMNGIGFPYERIFQWHYEGPVDGRGTFCEPCAESPKEALRLVRSYL